MRILVVVGTKQSANLCHRKGKGSLAMQFSQGLVDPNLSLIRAQGKGNRLIFLYCSSIRGNTSLITDTFG